MSEGEVWEFLDGAHTGVLTTLRRDGWPVPTPVWFVARDGAVWTRTPARARKVARIRHDSRVSFLVESGLAWTELRAVVLLGTAAVVDDAALRDGIDLALRVKYAAHRPPTTVPPATRRHYGGGDVLIRLVPDERVLSWDNSRIRLRADADG